MSKNYSKYTILNVLTLLVILVLVMGCRGRNTNKAIEQLSDVDRRSNEHITVWPKPDSYAERIPVYDKFEGLEPLFRFDNDTTYVVNFWATWCKPCIKELPYFEALNSSLKNEKVKVILVSLDFPKQVESNLVPFVQKKQLKSQVMVLLDGKYNDWIDKVSPEWSGAIPATYIYKGEQNHLVAAPFENLEELSQVVKPFL